MTTIRRHETRLCAWRSAEVHARNGRTRPGDPDPCYAEVAWKDVYARWVHVDSRLDADHKSVVGRVDDRDDDERGEALRQRYGIDGTRGDAQDVDHPFHPDSEGWCVVYGLNHSTQAVDHQKERHRERRTRHDRPAPAAPARRNYPPVAARQL